MVADYFRDLNEKLRDKLVKKLQEGFPWRVVEVVGPPRSGKTYFIENYLLSRLREAGRDVELRERTATSRDELDKACGDAGPYRLVYCIPWDGAKQYASDDAKRAVQLIIKHFDDRPIEYLGFRYMPPGFVAEVVGRLSTDAAEYVEIQSRAYSTVERLFSGFKWYEVPRILLNALSSVVSGVIGLAGVIDLAGAAADILILLAKGGESPVDAFIELRDSWPKLHDDLKTILSYKIALKLELKPGEARK
ncbi:MAG: hypothetical protein ACPL3C_12410, partial [Pyrobaculum sp.]